MATSVFGIIHKSIHAYGEQVKYPADFHYSVLSLYNIAQIFKEKIELGPVLTNFIKDSKSFVRITIFTDTIAAVIDFYDALSTNFSFLTFSIAFSNLISKFALSAETLIAMGLAAFLLPEYLLLIAAVAGTVCYFGKMINIGANASKQGDLIHNMALLMLNMMTIATFCFFPASLPLLASSFNITTAFGVLSLVGTFVQKYSEQPNAPAANPPHIHAGAERALPANG